MLWQLRLCRRFDALSLYGRRPSIGLGPFHGCGLPECNHQRVLSDLPVAAAAVKATRWLMLNIYGCRTDDSFTADTKTIADSHTFEGRPLRVSFGRAAPPASSFLYYDFPDSEPNMEDDRYDNINVIAAHTDAVLLEMRNRRCPPNFETNNHFVYTAGAAGPPSLSLIPVRDLLTKSESVYAHRFVRQPFRPSLYSGSTGLLRRGENDLLVVQLELWYDRDARREMLEFCVLRPGTDDMSQWELMEPVPILLDENDVAPPSSGDDAVPVGDRYLCWVDYKNGFFLCDMADEARSKVHYVPVPAEVSRCCSYDDHDHDDYDDKDEFPIKYTKKMGAAGASRVRFVSIDPHCCCGGPGRSTCAHSRFAFTIRTWTMDLSMDGKPLAWVKDGEMDCEEIWALPGYEGLPRANLLCPVVSLDNPDVVCFLVSNRHLKTHGDLKV